MTSLSKHTYKQHSSVCVLIVKMLISPTGLEALFHYPLYALCYALFVTVIQCLVAPPGHVLWPGNPNYKVRHEVFM